MSPANHRHLRVGEEIAHEINAMLVGELKDPRLEGMVVANEVRVQQDMKHARVFVSVDGTDEEQAGAIKALEHAAGYIRVAREADRTRHGPGRRSGCGRSRKTILGKGFRQPSPGMLIEYVFY